VKVLIVDDQLLIRQALIAMIDKHPKYRVVGEADNGEQATELAENTQPDLIILDIHMPIMDGEETAKSLSKIRPESLILALSGVSDKNRITQLFQAGISGFLSKDDISYESLVGALDTVSAGEVFLSPKIFAKEIEQGKGIEDIISESLGTQLTKREKSILIELSQGLSNIEVGEKLFISDRTVAKHRENIMRKSGSNNVAQLINYAKKSGFID
jgi:DNA-binding NarL/FixJ family response regulator